MKKSFRRMMAVVLMLCMAVSLYVTVPARASSVEEGFNDFMEEQWIETIESDYLSMHFYVEDWRSMGLEKPELTLGDVSLESWDGASESDQELLNELHEFDEDQLSDNARAAYELLEEYLECRVVMDAHPEFEEMFNPYTGYLTNYITNFTEFVFRCEEDVEDYLVLLADFDRLIIDMIAFTEETVAESGYFMPDSVLDEALEEMEDFLAKGDENPLIVIFDENLEALGGDAVNRGYQEENKRIVLEEIFPAYEEAIEFLSQMYGSRLYGGICEYPGGSEYFEAQIQYQTATEESADELYDFLDACINNSIEYYRAKASDTVNQVDFSDAEEILEYLRTNLDAFPEAPDVNYEVSYLDPSIANPSTVAYYLSAPVDDYSDNVIRVNGDAVSDMNELYATLSHEGYPGHLYQFTYWLSSGEAYNLSYVVGSMGYQEGWAMYVENVMIRRSGLDEGSYVNVEVNNFYGYAMNAQLDLGINAFGWTEKDVADFLDPDGYYYTDEEIQEVYDYFLAIPGVILSYGVGDAMFMTYRAWAEMSLGSEFDEVEFHEVLLQHGSRPFDVVEEDVRDYIESKGYEVQDSYYAYSLERGMRATPEALGDREYDYEDDYDDDYEEEPAFGDEYDDDRGNQGSRRGKKSSSTGLSVFGILLIVAGGILVVGAAVVLIVVLSNNKKKKNQQHAQNPYGQMPYGQGQNPYGQNQYGQNQYSQNQYRQNPYGQNQYAQNSYGQNQYTQNPYGQSQPVQNPYAQGQPVSNPYGQGQYNQNRYGQNQYPQNPYGQGQYVQNPYNQNPYNASQPGGPQANGQPTEPQQPINSQQQSYLDAMKKN